MDALREKIIKTVDDGKGTYEKIALDIHAKPEVSNYEFFACETLSNQLKAEGFDVKVDVAGHRTGFAAYYKSGKPGPVIAFLAEYDALAGLGHGCGHNLFGAASSLAAVAMKSILEQVGGEVRVLGTPGEEGGENGSSKGSFVREGFLEDVDAALCVHPGANNENTLSEKNLACVPIDIEYWGRASHAAAQPEKGINALDALIMTYNAINALRQQLTDDVRIHGIVVKGGDAPNTIPDHVLGKFYLRAASLPTLKDVYAKVERIVEGAALQTGAKSRMEAYQNWVENMVLTPSLDALFEKNLELFGEKVTHYDRGVQPGSSDVGNISQVVPTIQPMIGIADKTIDGHSTDMVAASCSRKGLDFIAKAAKVLAFTALDLIEDPALLAKIKEEHAYNVAHQ